MKKSTVLLLLKLGIQYLRLQGDSNEDLIKITHERDLDSQKSCDVIDTMSHSTRDVNDDVFPGVLVLMTLVIQ